MAAWAVFRVRCAGEGATTYRKPGAIAPEIDHVWPLARGAGVWGAVYPHRRAGSGPAAERKGPVQEPLTGQETHLPNRSAGPLGCATQGIP